MRSGIRLLLLTAVAGSALPATAQLLDDIDVRRDQGVTEFRLQFNMPVHYLRHFPAERGELLKVYLQGRARDGLEPEDMQTFKRTPVVAGIPPFTVTYTTVRNCYAVIDPVCLDIQFSKPVSYRIRPGEDGRSLILVVLPESAPARAPKPGQPAP